MSSDSEPELSNVKIVDRETGKLRPYDPEQDGIGWSAKRMRLDGAAAEQVGVKRDPDAESDEAPLVRGDPPLDTVPHGDLPPHLVEAEGAAEDEERQQILGHEADERNQGLVEDPNADMMAKTQAMLELEIASVGKHKYLASRDFEQDLMAMFKEKGWGTGGDGEPDQPSGGLEGDDAVLWDLLHEARKTGFKFKKRTALGSRFERWMKKHWDEEKIEAYENGSNPYKDKARQDWALERFDNLEKTRKLIEERVESGQTIGVPMNLDALIVAEGGFDRPSAVEGALNIARNMIRKGPPFVSINPDSGRLEFTRRTKTSVVDNRKRYQDIKEESNNKKQRMGSASSASGSLAQAQSEAAGQRAPAPLGPKDAGTPLKTEKGKTKGNKDQKETSSPKLKGGGKGKDKKGKGGKKGSGTNQNKKQTKMPEGRALTKAIQDAINLYSTTTHSARSILKKAETDPEWSKVRSFLQRVQTRLEKVVSVHDDEEAFSNMIVNGIEDDSFAREDQYKSSLKVTAELERLQQALTWLRQMKEMSYFDDGSE